MEDRHVVEAEGYETLGPGYFSARESAEKVMVGFEAEHFKPLLKKFTDAFTDAMWEKFQDFLISDAELNVQGHIWRDVDAIVSAIVGGEQWALHRYVLRDNISCETARQTIAALIPKEVMDARIVDLEKEVSRLQSSLDAYRERY